MTPEEFEKRMRKLQKNDDEEGRHVFMDKLMCEVLIELGYKAGVDIFEGTCKWYA